MKNSKNPLLAHRYKKIFALSLYGLALGLAQFLFTNIPTAQTPADAKDPSVERFDLLVREDFFAGFGGDQKALERALKLCEERLAKYPKHPEALVWHGAGIFYQSGQAFQKGDQSKAMELWERGLKEMDEAVALRPDSISVRIPRGAGTLAAAKHVPIPAMAQMLSEKGVSDFEKVLELQKAYFDKLSLHARGELLAGLAEGWDRLGNLQKSRSYLTRIVKECPGSLYAQRAQQWLDEKTPAANRKALTCLGCHTK